MRRRSDVFLQQLCMSARRTLPCLCNSPIWSITLYTFYVTINYKISMIQWYIAHMREQTYNSKIGTFQEGKRVFLIYIILRVNFK